MSKVEIAVEFVMLSLIGDENIRILLLHLTCCIIIAFSRVPWLHNGTLYLNWIPSLWVFNKKIRICCCFYSCKSSEDYWKLAEIVIKRFLWSFLWLRWKRKENFLKIYESMFRKFTKMLYLYIFIGHKVSILR